MDHDTSPRRYALPASPPSETDLLALAEQVLQHAAKLNAAIEQAAAEGLRVEVQDCGAHFLPRRWPTPHLRVEVLRQLPDKR